MWMVLVAMVACGPSTDTRNSENCAETEDDRPPDSGGFEDTGASTDSGDSGDSGEPAYATAIATLRGGISLSADFPKCGAYNSITIPGGVPIIGLDPGRAFYVEPADTEVREGLPSSDDLGPHAWATGDPGYALPTQSHPAQLRMWTACTPDASPEVGTHATSAEWSVRPCVEDVDLVAYQDVCTPADEPAQRLVVSVEFTIAP